MFSALPRLRRAPALHALALAAACALPGAALAQQPPTQLPTLRLKTSPMLSESLPATGTALPTFVRGARIIGGSSTVTAVEGDAELRKAGMTLRSARLQHDARSDIASTDSQVHLNYAGDRYQGSSARMQMDAHEAVVHNPSYQLRASGAHGTAQRLDTQDAGRVTIWGATYTTCPRDEAMPDWILRAKRLDLDQEEGVGRAQGAVLEFKGFPLLPLPGVSFPLNEARRSGLLAPTIGLDNKSGLSFLQPYYWNIAPNRDATLWPTLMQRRGLDLGGQFRYLERNYNGRISAHYMAGDRLRSGRDRWGVFARHNATLHTGAGPVGAYLNLNRVSDGDHWRDFSLRGSAFTTTRLLANDGGLRWQRGHFSFSALASKWQTLQSVGDSVITPPYDRLPQLTARYARMNHGGFDYSAQAGFTRFRGDPHYRGRQVDADRAHALVQVARPFERPWGFVTPMAQLHSTHYSFSSTSGTTPNNQQRTVPTFSLDSGLVFERSTSFRGHTLLQTLEPRLKYVYTPYREQSAIPLYDTGAYDFNFATIWAENPYTGHDRIADNNLVTAGVTTRFIDAASGAEKLRLAVAQRYRFQPQRLTNTDKGWSDMMLGAGLHWSPRWSFDSTVQYNTHTRRSTRATLVGRYTPGPYRALNLAYRWQRRQYPLSSEYIDISWQWPLGRLGELGISRSSAGGSCGQGGRWYSVGRLNYSRSDSHLIDGVLGVEYDAGCWIGRFVMERTNLGSTSASKRILFQLEFRGLGRVGNNPLASLRTHIPRYRPLGESVAPTTSRFHSYD